jgi:hypothetical protein
VHSSQGSKIGASIFESADDMREELDRQGTPSIWCHCDVTLTGASVSIEQGRGCSVVLYLKAAVGTNFEYRKMFTAGSSRLLLQQPEVHVLVIPAFGK